MALPSCRVVLLLHLFIAPWEQIISNKQKQVSKKSPAEVVCLLTVRMLSLRFIAHVFICVWYDSSAVMTYGHTRA